MRGAVLFLVIHMAQTYGLDELDCAESRLIMKQDYCDSSNTTTLTMHALAGEFSNINLAEAILNNGCHIESDVQVGNNTFYIECETEDINCVEHGDSKHKDDIRNVFLVECEDVTLMEPKQVVEPKANLMPILAGSTAAALGTTGVGFVLYKLKTVCQSGSYLIPA